jgi:hypothetical protein
MSFVFDIETLALDRDRLAELFEPKQAEPPEPQLFDPATVKYGNTKDPAKRAAKLEDAEERWNAEQQEIGRKYETGVAEEFDRFCADAALSPVTSSVAIVAYHGVESGKTLLMDIEATDERQMLASLWSKCTECRNEGGKIFTVNGHDFDLPYCCQRSWILSVEVPDWIIEKNRYWSPAFVDLRRVWQCGKYGGGGVAAKSSFSWLAKAFGTEGKPDGADGSMFSEMWANDREAARAYARSDVEQPAVWAKKMGVI